MCEQCTIIIESTDAYKQYKQHPISGAFINFYNGGFQLCDIDGMAACNIDCCPWCGRNLYNDSNTVHAEAKEECHSYAFQLTTFDSDIQDVEITDLFYPDYKSIEECEQALKRLIDEGETGDCAHVFKLVPVKSYRLVKHWEER